MTSPARFVTPARTVLLFVVLAAATAAWSHGRWWRLPDRHNPWAVLHIDEEPGWLTRYKLHRLDERPFECLAVLASAAMQADPVPDRAPEAGCGWRNAVRVRRTQWQADPPFVLSCRAAVSLALWERHVVAPQAERLLGERPLRLEHFGSYACRNVNNAGSGSRSRHASADALDVSGFVFARGRRVTVAGSWKSAAAPAGAAAGTAVAASKTAAEAAFLRAVHDGACDYFDVVLGPDHNRLHADHLHLDRGGGRTCR